MAGPRRSTTRAAAGTREPDGRADGVGGRADGSRPARAHLLTLVTALLGAAVLLAGCGGNLPNLPSLTGTRTSTSTTGSTSGTGSGSATSSDSGTTSETSSSSATSSSSTSSSPTSTATSTTSSATQSPSSTRTPTTQPSTSAAGTGGTSDQGPSPWLWVLLAAALIALVVILFALRRSRVRRREWQDRLAQSSSEVAWFSRALIPQLRQEPTSAHVAGGWRMAAPRVHRVEESLATLVQTAPDEEAAGQAMRLRDAVRTARERIDVIGRPGAAEDAGPELAAAGAELEAALAPLPSWG